MPDNSALFITASASLLFVGLELVSKLCHSKLAPGHDFGYDGCRKENFRWLHEAWFV